MAKKQRSWTDEVFELFVSGALSPLDAAQVRAAIDRLEADSRPLEKLRELEGDERRRQLARLLLEVARDR